MSTWFALLLLMPAQPPEIDPLDQLEKSGARPAATAPGEPGGKAATKKAGDAGLPAETAPAAADDGPAGKADGAADGKADAKAAPEKADEKAEGKADEKADGKSDSKSGSDADEAAAGGDAAGGFWQLLDDMMHSGAMGYMIEGGFFMWPILILGIVAFGVIIERYRSLKMLTTDTSALRDEVQRLLQADRVEEALKKCDAEQGPVPAILSAGLRKFLVMRRLDYDAAKIEEQVVKGMDDYSVHVVAALERHLPILATVSSVAPMLGFLGTVQGMVVSFDDIVAQMGKTNIVEAAAAGIKVSLLTTVLGLVVGIPAFMAFNYFTSVINRFVLEVEESASELIETVTLQMAMQRRDAGK
ncbi:MAG: Biopolymer transport protein ExbB [Planctomycetota bacterium]